VAKSSDGNTATFEVEAQQPFVYFKPRLIKNGSMHWAVGTNNLLIMAGEDNRVVYPYFFSDPRGRFSPLVEVESAILNRRHRLRVYLPPGYDENTLARYPFAYMQDGQNLFFPHEAFQHKDWGVNETSQILRTMQAIEDFIIVGVHSDERREEEYTKPGYEAYARSIVEELVPAEQLFLRTTRNRLDRTMWGFLARRRRFVLHCLATSGSVRRRRLHVEHLFSQRRSARTRPERAEAENRLLSR